MFAGDNTVKAEKYLNNHTLQLYCFKYSYFRNVVETHIFCEPSFKRNNLFFYKKNIKWQQQ